MPRLPHKVSVHVSKCHACNAKDRGVTAGHGRPSAPPEPAQCCKCHACCACHQMRDKVVCVTKLWKSCVWKSRVWQSCLWQSCLWRSFVCERVVCDKVLCDKVVFVCVCVCDKVVCVWESCVCDKPVCDKAVCGGGRGRRECTLEKIEPHSMMWGKTALLDDSTHACCGWAASVSRQLGICSPEIWWFIIIFPLYPSKKTHLKNKSAHRTAYPPPFWHFLTQIVIWVPVKNIQHLGARTRMAGIVGCPSMVTKKRYTWKK